jgi:hypothetical protein
MVAATSRAHAGKCRCRPPPRLLSTRFRAIGARFTVTTSVGAIVETPDDGPSEFQQAASAGKGPDNYGNAEEVPGDAREARKCFSVALRLWHDRTGEWVASGLLHSVTPRCALGNVLVHELAPSVGAQP